MMGFTSCWRSAALAAIGVVAGCSSGGGDSGGDRATLDVSLMDAPVDGLTEVRVQITALWLKPAGAGPAIELPLTATSPTLDLLTLGETNAALLVDDATIEPGEYEWLAMDVNAEFDGIYDSYVMTAVGGQEELRVPSGRVRLVSGFTVGPSQAVRLLFDWDLRRGLVGPPGQPGYLLKPAFRVIDVTEYGALRGSVADATIGSDPTCVTDDIDVRVGNVVYVFEGAGVVPDDIDEAGVEPLATVAVTQDDQGAYVYRTILAPGPYTVAFTCVAVNDDPDADDVLEFSEAADVMVAADVASVVDF